MTIVFVTKTKMKMKNNAMRMFLAFGLLVFMGTALNAQVVLDGYRAGTNKQGDVEIKNKNNKALHLSTNNVRRLSIDSVGSIIIPSLSSGLATDSILTVDPTTGVVKRRSLNSVTPAGSITLTNATSSPQRDSLARAIAISTLTTPLKDSIASAAVRNIKMENGLNKGANGDSILLGGALTKATTITTTAANTLAVAGLQSGLATDSILTVDPVTGVIKRRNFTSVATPGSITLTNATSSPQRDTLARADALSVNQNTQGLRDTIVNNVTRNIKLGNGLNKGVNGDSILLGGALTKATNIITTATNTLALQGLQAADFNDSSLLTVDANGVVRKRLLDTVLAEFGFTTISLNNSINRLTMGVRGAVVGSNLTLAANPTNYDEYVINPTAYIPNIILPSSAIIGKVLTVTNNLGSPFSVKTTNTNLRADLRLDAFSDRASFVFDGVIWRRIRGYVNYITGNSLKISNGMNAGINSDSVLLGGDLNKPTTITTTATNTFAIAGLQVDTVATRLLTVNASTGVISSMSLNSIRSTNSATSLTSSDNIVIYTGTANVTFSLPNPATLPNKTFTIINQGDGAVTLSLSIFVSSGITLSVIENLSFTSKIRFVSDGTNWIQTN